MIPLGGDGSTASAAAKRTQARRPPSTDSEDYAPEDPRASDGWGWSGAWSDEDWKQWQAAAQPTKRKWTPKQPAAGAAALTDVAVSRASVQLAPAIAGPAASSPQAAPSAGVTATAAANKIPTASAHETPSPTPQAPAAEAAPPPTQGTAATEAKLDELRKRGQAQFATVTVAPATPLTTQPPEGPTTTAATGTQDALREVTRLSLELDTREKALAAPNSRVAALTSEQSQLAGLVAVLAEKLSSFWPFVCHAVRESDEVIKHAQCLQNYRQRIEPAAAELRTALTAPDLHALLTQGLAEQQFAAFQQQIAETHLPKADGERSHQPTKPTGTAGGTSVASAMVAASASDPQPEPSQFCVPPHQCLTR